MTTPTEDEVRAHLEREAATMERSAETARMVRFDDSTHMRLAAIYRSALAMLDEARKDRALIDNLLIACRALDVGQRSGDVHQAQRALLNWRKALAAIDQARGA